MSRIRLTVIAANRKQDDIVASCLQIMLGLAVPTWHHEPHGSASWRHDGSKHAPATKKLMKVFFDDYIIIFDYFIFIHYKQERTEWMRQMHSERPLAELD
jgi:hypothetical protein